jgi:hypothetical protein
MAKNCIICPRQNGSREHTFPATLGGRRTNKGIYCGLHNERFSPLAAILSRQLNAINALLGVRPDHSDRPTRLGAENPTDGHKYVVSGQSIEFAEPRVLDHVELPDKTYQREMLFSSERQLQDWLAEQRKAGVEVKITGRGPSGNAFFTQRYPVRLSLGGAEGLRAMGYVALSFLAHHFPGVVRQRGLKPFKDYVCEKTAEQLVWWDFDPFPHDARLENPFSFGHRIVVGLSATRQEAYARVSLFSTLDFAACLGTAKVDQDQTRITFIDPLADHPPHDIREVKVGDEALAPVVRPASLADGLQQAIHGGEAEERFRTLLRRISDWLLDKTIEGLLPKINATRATPIRMRHQQLRELLQVHEQRIFNLLQFGINGLKAHLATNPSTASMASAIDRLIASDPNSPTGITKEAACALELGITALVAHINERLDAGELTAEDLKLLLAGGPGAAIVTEAATRPLMMLLAS